MIAAPLFHAWGFANWALSISLASTVVLKRKFDEEATLSLTAQHECTALVVVPVMLQRILGLDDEVLQRYDLSALRAREKWLIAAPLFHSWGFAHFTLGLLLSTTYVLQRKFDPEQTLAGAERNLAQEPADHRQRPWLAARRPLGGAGGAAGEDDDLGPGLGLGRVLG